MSRLLHGRKGLRRSMMRRILGRASTQASASANAASGSEESSSSEDRIEPQPRKRARTGRALSQNSDNDWDDTPSDAQAGAFEEAEGLSPSRKNKGKERERTTEEEDSQAENVSDRDWSSEQARRDEDKEEDGREGVESKEEDLDDDEGPVYHNAIWDQLVDLAGRSGSYTHLPVHGKEPEDVTAFEPACASWGKHRANRPPVLSLWMPPRTRKNPDYEIEDLTYDGRTVVDWEGEPIRAFDGLPLTISSRVEGWRVETWIRNDNRVTYRDIVARMKTKDGAGGRVPIFGTRALATRASQFRDHAGCVSWKILSTQARSRAYMNGLRTSTQRRNNLTTDTDLTSDQYKAYLSITRSRYSQSTTVRSAGRSTPRPKITGSSNAGPSRPRRIAPNLGATGLEIPGPSTTPRRSGRRTASRRCQEASTQKEDGEHKGDKQDESDKHVSFLGNVYVDEGEEGEEALLDTSPIDEGDEEAELPHSFLLNRPGEQVSNSDPDSYNTDSKDGDSADDDSADGVPANDSSGGGISEEHDSGYECSISSEPENSNDARNHVPRDAEEAVMLQAALRVTRDDFRRLSGQTPSETNLMENYFSQWATLQTQLSAVFQAQGKVNDRTILFGLDGWVGGIPNWESARSARSDRTFEDEGV